jgi:ribosomal protein S19
MSDSTSAVTNLQKLIKQLQKDALQQTLKQHADPLAKIHTIMRENNLTPDMVSLTFKQRKPRTKSQSVEPKIKPTVEPTNKIPVAMK